MVREYLKRFCAGNDTLVLDPFAGTGTTLVEAKKHSIPSLGMEVNPVVHLAASVKTDWDVDPSELKAASEGIASKLSDSIGWVLDTGETYDGQLRTLPEESAKLLLKGSISPLPLHKSLVLRDEINKVDPHLRQYLQVALASMLVKDAGNLRFGPEVGVTRPKNDVDVLGSWLARVYTMCEDISSVSDIQANSVVLRKDSRIAVNELEGSSVDMVITSPPYPNEKDYTRTTRLEDVVLGFVNSKRELQGLKKQLVRSNTRGVYKADDDDLLVEKYPEITALADEIERRRVELGKTSGFERMYHRVTRLYFGGMARHFMELRACLRPGARLAYVVGDQASYLRVLIRTAPLLGIIAESLGYQVESIDLFRTRAATATREQLREEVLVLKWLG